MGITSIEWTSRVLPDGNIVPGYTFNGWRGCVEVSPGCAHCYARKLSLRDPAVLGRWGGMDKGGTRVFASVARWEELLRWNRDAGKAGRKALVFAHSLSDVFEDWSGPILAANERPLWWCGASLSNSPVPSTGLPRDSRWFTMDDAREILFQHIDECKNLVFQLVTKRPQNILRMWPADGRRRENVWLLTSVESQATADERIPHLLRCRRLAPVLGLSMEPLLECVDISRWLSLATNDAYYASPEFRSWHQIDWVIVGGESGPDARPCGVTWIGTIAHDCATYKTPCFVKQLGSRVEARNDAVSHWFEECGHLDLDATERYQGAVGRVRGFRDPKGGDPSEWPSDLRVRQFPPGV